MKKVCLLVGIVCSVALLAPMANAGEVYSRNVVGYHNITIEPGLNLVAFPFQKIPADTGVISAHDAHDEITVTDVDFATLLPGADDIGKKTFYIEITTDAFEGRYFYIVAIDNDTLTVGLPENEADSDVKANDLVGAGYKIVAANRIVDIFGSGDGLILSGGPSAADADTILRWDGTAWEPAIYYESYGIPGFPEGWKQAGNAVGDLVVGRDKAVFVRRSRPSSVTLTVVGEVSQNEQAVVLSKGLNLVGGLSVVAEILNDSNLTEALQGGPTAADADSIISWENFSNWSSAIYYETFGIPGFPEGWKQAGSDAGDLALDPIKGYFLRLLNQDASVWRRESPIVSK